MKMNSINEWVSFSVVFSDNTEKMFIMSPSHYKEAKRIINMFNRKLIQEDACRDMLLALDKN